MAPWRHDHPGIDIITRDRSTEFTRGATDGAPHAIQVADRWHVRTNLRETVERMLQRRMPDLTRLLTPTRVATTPSTARPVFPQRTSAQARDARLARSEERAQRFQTIRGWKPVASQMPARSRPVPRASARTRRPCAPP